MWKIIQKRWYVKLFTLVLAGVGVAIDHFDHKPGAPANHDLGEGLTVAIIFVLVIFAVEAIYGLYEDLEALDGAFKQRLSTSQDALSAQLVELDEKISVQINVQSKEVELLKAMGILQGSLKTVLVRLYEKLQKTLTISGGQFIVQNHHFALLCYVDFWESLVESQNERAKNNQPGLTALVVHRCSIDIWNDPTLEKVFAKQEKFKKSGGNIHRILCGPTKLPGENYRKIAAKMEAAGIHVSYCDTTTGVLPAETIWDFLVVKETGQAVIWKSVSVDEKIEAAIFSDTPVFGTAKLVELWEQIKKEAIEIKDEHPSGPK